MAKLRSKAKIFIITGPSGAGKTTIFEEILKLPSDLARVITYTTRKKRENEIDGKDYHFISKESFLEKVSSKKMFEYAEVYGNLYGSSKEAVEKLLSTGKEILFAIDLRGAETIKEIFPESIEIFILPPSLEELGKRINKRGDKNKSDIAQRLEEAGKEIVKSKFFKHIVINDDLNKAVFEVRQIIQAN
ncbi:guanylate kinase [Candidatus Pacearchaeota archaeon CG1_02_32_132]|nr:MAG: guanylate kinase [Candidatus Pacearchaeota archaeon CG1_02_32_132]